MNTTTTPHSLRCSGGRSPGRREGVDVAQITGRGASVDKGCPAENSWAARIACHGESFSKLDAPYSASDNVHSSFLQLCSM
ncbi:hypothetical protein Y032_0100g3277 [Ancylostoma ceylanicum]|nr:hypothetical protein Y032_0100g3277 [Ancylostoma ceylanicum]